MMNAPPPAKQERFTPRAIVLVTLQFVLAAALVLTTAMPPEGLVVWGLTTFGAALAIWAWATMGLRRLRILPAPGHDTQLVEQGPYAFIRHPMYSGLLLFCGGLVLHDPRPWRLLLYLALIAVLFAKASYEEQLLTRHLPGYAKYRQRTGRFSPWL